MGGRDDSRLVTLRFTPGETRLDNSRRVHEVNRPRGLVTGQERIERLQTGHTGLEIGGVSIHSHKRGSTDLHIVWTIAATLLAKLAAAPRHAHPIPVLGPVGMEHKVVD